MSKPYSDDEIASIRREVADRAERIAHEFQQGRYFTFDPHAADADTRRWLATLDAATARAAALEAKVASWESALESLRDDVLHNADGIDSDIVNGYLWRIDDADPRPYVALSPPAQREGGE